MPKQPTGERADAERGTPASRPLRADAQRNTAALLEAAAAVFATSGVDAPVRAIALKAGVGVGTVYRHFPQRADLIVAVFHHLVDACADAAAVLAADHAPGAALALWMQCYANFIATKRGLASALHSGNPAYNTLPAYFDTRLRPALQALLDAAARAGAVRSDIAPDDLLRAVASLCMAAHDDQTDYVRRMVALLVDGLRSTARPAEYNKLPTSMRMTKERLCNTMDDVYAQIEHARAAIAERTTLAPRVGLILGSGLGALADEIEDATVIPYADVPGFPRSTVQGHRGELALGQLAGQPVAVMRGRFHFYEGYSMQQVTFPVRVLRALGCTALIVTNAAGGLRPDWAVGDLMRMTDQIFLPGLAGHHPLCGPNDDRLGLRFPAVVGAFENELAQIARAVAAEQGTVLRAGVYVMVSGPAFESGAELRMLRAWGADVVGMSTAPEIIVALHAGMQVLGISLVTNLALPDGTPANHEEVNAAGAAAKPTFSALLRGILGRM